MNWTHPPHQTNKQVLVNWPFQNRATMAQPERRGQMLGSSVDSSEQFYSASVTFRSDITNPTKEQNSEFTQPCSILLFVINKSLMWKVCKMQEPTFDSKHLAKKVLKFVKSQIFRLQKIFQEELYPTKNTSKQG